jgi:hypothetical protein
MTLILSTICPTASHNVPAVVLAGEADLVENEGVLHPWVSDPHPWGGGS